MPEVSPTKAEAGSVRGRTGVRFVTLSPDPTAAFAERAYGRAPTAFGSCPLRDLAGVGLIGAVMEAATVLLTVRR